MLLFPPTNVTLNCTYAGGFVVGKCAMMENGLSNWLPFDLSACKAKTYTSNKLLELKVFIEFVCSVESRACGTHISLFSKTT